MKVVIDLNVILDVFQKREPHYGASARILASAAKGEMEALLPSHCLTTLHYITTKHADTDAADAAIDWVLSELRVQPEDEKIYLRARSLPLADFEDAVVAACAEKAKCACVITRNVSDFQKSPVTAMTPEEFLATLPAQDEKNTIT